MGLVFDVTDKKIAKDFVDEMLSNNTNLNVFIKLLNRWNSLSLSQREEVIRQCSEDHPSAHQFENDSNSNKLVEYICSECGFKFKEPIGWRECDDCGSKYISRIQ